MLCTKGWRYMLCLSNCMRTLNSSSKFGWENMYVNPSSYVKSKSLIGKQPLLLALQANNSLFSKSFLMSFLQWHLSLITIQYCNFSFSATKTKKTINNFLHIHPSSCTLITFLNKKQKTKQKQQKTKQTNNLPVLNYHISILYHHIFHFHMRTINSCWKFIAYMPLYF